MLAACQMPVNRKSRRINYLVVINESSNILLKLRFADFIVAVKGLRCLLISKLSVWSVTVNFLLIRAVPATYICSACKLFNDSDLADSVSVRTSKLAGENRPKI